MWACTSVCMFMCERERLKEQEKEISSVSTSRQNQYHLKVKDKHADTLPLLSYLLHTSLSQLTSLKTQD